MKITLSYLASSYNGDPEIVVLVNEINVFSGNLKGQGELDITFHYDNRADVIIRGIGKRFGDHGIWDTQVDDQGRILQDKYLRIEAIKIDDIDMGFQWTTTLPMINNGDSGNDLNRDAVFYENGEMSFSINGPVLDWIIDQKYLRTVYHAPGTFSRSGDDKFEYRTVAERIQVIKSMLDDQDHYL